ncbi:hypothetical protein LX36DRAFT_659552 [Colletotrichum falcatum]|nr:hypothetical protein LX36DRAFT_659552 [Colletotrichum falcatum]
MTIVPLAREVTAQAPLLGLYSFPPISFSLLSFVALVSLSCTDAPSLGSVPKAKKKKSPHPK